MFCWAVLITAFGPFDYQAFFLVAFVWLLVLTVLTTPTSDVPPWRRRLQWIVIAGGIAAALMLIEHIVQTISRAGWT